MNPATVRKPSRPLRVAAPQSFSSYRPRRRLDPVRVVRSEPGATFVEE